MFLRVSLLLLTMVMPIIMADQRVLYNDDANLKRRRLLRQGRELSNNTTNFSEVDEKYLAYEPTIFSQEELEDIHAQINWVAAEESDEEESDDPQRKLAVQETFYPTQLPLPQMPDWCLVWGKHCGKMRPMSIVAQVDT